MSKKIYLSLIFLLVFSLSFLTAISYDYTTKVYQCNPDGTATYLKEVSQSDIHFCYDENKNNYLTIGGTSSGVCYSSDNIPCTYNTAVLNQDNICYEAIGKKCIEKPKSNGQCGNKQFSNLQDCITYINYYGGGINLTSLFLGGMLIVLLVILIVLIIFVRKKKLKKINQ